MKNFTTMICGSVLALGLVSMGCDEAQPGDDEFAAENEDDTAEDVEDRLFCLYSSTPPATDDSASLIGAVDEVESDDAANGGCDLHMFKVAAAPPSDRARTVEVSAWSIAPFEDFGGRVWRKSCTTQGICTVGFTTESIPFTTGGGGVACPTINDCFPLPYWIHGELALSASNSVVDLRAGARATASNGNPVDVTITVSE